MNQMQTNHTFQLSKEDVNIFCAASYDRNPLHLSTAYARKTAYGEPVVYGILGGIVCLGSLQERPGLRLARVDFDFSAPMFVDIPYSLDLREESVTRVKASIYDGKREILKATFLFKEGAILMAASSTSAVLRQDAVLLTEECLDSGIEATGSYWPADDSLQLLIDRFGLTNKGVDLPQLATLLWCSYVTGMELPGERALFYKMSMTWVGDQQQGTSPLVYRAQIKRWDSRFNLLRVSADLKLSDQGLATGELWSFLRPEVPRLQDAASSDNRILLEKLTGKIALVIGASRGLGATIAQMLVVNSCIVLANYVQSTADMEQLAASVSESPGKIIPVQGDGSNMAWCQQLLRDVLEEYGRLDYLICNACPALQPLTIEATSINRINRYVADSFALVSVPIAIFGETIELHRGCITIISSEYVNSLPGHWPHYISAKAAVEGFARAASVNFQHTRYLIVRPPQLATSFSSTPLVNTNPMPPRQVAVKIVHQIAKQPLLGGVEILDDFT